MLFIYDNVFVCIRATQFCLLKDVLIYESHVGSFFPPSVKREQTSMLKTNKPTNKKAILTVI